MIASKKIKETNKNAATMTVITIAEYQHLRKEINKSLIPIKEFLISDLSI